MSEFVKEDWKLKAHAEVKLHRENTNMLVSLPYIQYLIIHSAVGMCENISHLDTNLPMCILLKDFLHFKKMPRHKYFRHLIIQGGPKM